MFKVIKKHKIFILLILALITLATGFLFVGGINGQTSINAGEENQTIMAKFFAFWQDDQDYYWTNSTYKSYWEGGEWNTYRDSYYYTTYSGSLGSVGVYKYDNNGFSGDSKITCTADGDDRRIVETTADKGEGTFLWQLSCSAVFKKSYSISVKYVAMPEDGFCVIKEGTYDWIFSQFDATNKGAEHTVSGTIGGTYSEEADNPPSYAAIFAPKTYNVTLNANGGTFSDGKTTKEDSITYLKKYSFSSPTRTGYSFVAWGTDANSTTGITNSNYNSSIKSDGTTFYAIWKKNSCSVTYDAQGGTGGTGKKEATYDTKYPEITPPARSGYTFLGYFTGIDGGTQTHDSSGTGLVNCTTTSDHTLYAHWQANKYTITFDDPVANLLSDPGMELGEWAPAPGSLSTAYSLSGANSYQITATASNVEVYLRTSHKVSINKTHKYYVCIWGYQTEKTENAYVQCYWPEQEKSFLNQGDSRTIPMGTAGQWNLYSWLDNRDYSTITKTEDVIRFDFDNNSVAGTIYFDNAKLIDLTETYGSGNEPTKSWCDANLSYMQATTVTFDSDVQPLSFDLPTKAGYTFDGFEDSDGTKYFNADGTWASPNNSTTWTYAEDKTLYPIWIENTYSIVWRKNDGGGESKTSTVKYTESLPLFAQRFERIGYTQSSWRVGVSHEVQFSETISIESLGFADYTSLDMYAIWEENWINRAVAPSGSGTSSSPYQIASAENLAWLAYYVNHENTDSNKFIYCEQKASIDLSASKWFPIGTSSKPFKGVYDGKGYSISNLNTTAILNKEGEYLNSQVGMFGNVDKKNDAEKSEIRNVIIISGEVKGNSLVGSIAGVVQNTTIKGCSSYANVYCSNHSGGFVGRLLDNSLIENCYYKGQVIYPEGAKVGGFIGLMETATIKSCMFEGDEISFIDEISSATSSSKTFIEDCMIKTSTNAFIARVSPGRATIKNCLMQGEEKFYYGNTNNFANWVISTTKTPLPAGLSWLATGGVKVTALSQITGLGYTAA